MKLVYLAGMAAHRILEVESDIIPPEGHRVHIPENNIKKVLNDIPEHLEDLRLLIEYINYSRNYITDIVQDYEKNEVLLHLGEKEKAPIVKQAPYYQRPRGGNNGDGDGGLGIMAAIAAVM